SRSNTEQGITGIGWEGPRAPGDFYFRRERTQPSACNCQYAVEECQGCGKHKHIGNVQRGLGWKAKPGPRARKKRGLVGSFHGARVVGVTLEPSLVVSGRKSRPVFES